MSGQIITANRLIDGAVVYRTAEGGWSARLEDGARLAGEDAAGEDAPREDAEAALARVLAEGAGTVVEPYLIDLDDMGSDGDGGQDGDGRRPARYRERIRASGPSVRPDLGKQAVEPAGTAPGSAMPIGEASHVSL